MYYSQLNTQYINKIKENINDLEFKDIYYNVLDSFLDYYELFDKSSESNLWYNVSLSKLNIILDPKSKNTENRLSDALELFVELEIQGKEIEKDITNIFNPIDKKKHGIE